VIHPCIVCFWVPAEESPGGQDCAAWRQMCSNLVSGFLVEEPGDDEYPSGDMSCVHSILMFFGF